MTCKVGVVEGKELLLYSFPPPHPFTSQRAQRFWEALHSGSLSTSKIEPQKADPDLLRMFHTRDHIKYVELASHMGYGSLDQGDTPAFKGVFEAAQYAVGSTISAVEKVLSGVVDHAFNPVGGLHHATRESSAGFCVFNDVGVLIEHLRANRGIDRVLYVDIDVHHGDGVFYSYESDPNVCIYDVHEDGRFLYPGTGFPDETGLGEAEGTKSNIALAPGSADDAIFAQLKPLEEFATKAKPEIIIFQCGADGLVGDPIAGLRYTPEAHRKVGSLLHRLSHELCDGRIVALGGGGYVPDNCAQAWMAVVETFNRSA